jgi:predicted RNase H-like nuclease (RuvC/YqgF family)
VLSNLLSTGEGLAALILGAGAAIALGWAVTRTQALSAWRSASEGYKEQVNELTGRLERAEEKSVELHAKVTELETRPDMTAVIEALESRSAQNAATVVQAMRDMLAPVTAGIADLRRTLDRSEK